MEQVREICGSCGDKLQTHCTCSPLPELTNAIAEVERLKKAIRCGRATCAYCCETFSNGKDGVVEFQEHIKTCQDHPMRKLLDDNAVLKSALAGLALEPYPDGRTWCKVCRDWTHSETCPLA